MTRPLTIETLVVIVLWMTVATRFIVVLRRGSIAQSGAHRRQAWYFWSIFFCIALAATFRFEPVRGFLAAEIGSEFSKFPRTVISIFGYLLLVRVCYTLAPELRPRRDWPLYLSLLTFVCYTSLVLAASSNRVAATAALFTGDVIFHFHLLILAARITVPTLAWSRRQERQPPMRLRLLLMEWTHRGIALWMLNNTARDLAVVIGLPYNYIPVYYVALAITVPTFVIAYLMPSVVFLGLTFFIGYLSDLFTLILFRAVEYRARQLLGREMGALRLFNALFLPAEAVYRSTIAILDVRKALEVISDPRAQALAMRLRVIANPAIDYDRALERFWWIGLEVICVDLPAINRWLALNYFLKFGEQANVRV